MATTRPVDRKTLVFAAAYLGLSVAVTWPLILHLPDRIPNDYGDPLLNVWILNWIAETLPLSEAWWNGPQFFPSPGALSFSEHLMGLAPLSTPVIALTGNPVLAYNILFVLAFALSALAVHVLVARLTGRHDAALVAAVAWGFTPYRLDQTPHLQVIACWWMPVALTGMHGYLRDRRVGWLWLLAAAWLLQGLANGYFLFFFSLLVGAWLLWFGPGQFTRRDVSRLAVSGGVVALAVAPFLYGYWRRHSFHALERPLDVIAAFGADIAGLVTAPASLLVWGGLQVFPRPEGALFPGTAIVAIVVAGVIQAWRRSNSGRASLAAAAAAGLAVVAAAIAGYVLVAGKLHVSLAGWTLLSASSIDKPLTVAGVSAAGALLVHPRVRTAWRERSPLAFYVAAAVVMTLFALGPSPTLLGESVLYRVPAPYALLLEVPGLQGLRVPSRFWMIASLCLSIAGGLAFARLTRPGRILSPAIAALIVLEGWPATLPVLPLPPERPAIVEAVARLHLPTTLDTSVLWQAMQSRRVLINGHSGSVPRHYLLLDRLLTAHDPAAFDWLAHFGDIEILVEHDHDRDGRWMAFIASYPGVTRVARFPDYSVFRLPAALPVPHESTPDELLPVARFSATSNTEWLGAMVDGRHDTRWDTGAPQTPGQMIRADFDTPVDLTRVTIAIGASLSDFPRAVEVEVSADGEAWTPVWRGPTATAALLGSTLEPADTPITLPARARQVRAVRVRLTAAAPEWWSVTEFRAYGTHR